MSNVAVACCHIDIINMAWISAPRGVCLHLGAFSCSSDDVSSLTRKGAGVVGMPTVTNAGPFEHALGRCANRYGRQVDTLYAEPGAGWDYSDPAMAHLALAFAHITGRKFHLRYCSSGIPMPRSSLPQNQRTPLSHSALTAHAVLLQNREDGGNRRFIMVQFPEPLPKPEPELKTIADIGTERIRHVITGMQRSEEGQLPLDLHRGEDLGFKVFRLAPSNYQPWAGVAEETLQAYVEQMALFDDPLVAGWQVEDVIYEVALKEGYGLNCRIEPAAAGANVVHRVTDPDREQSFTVCLDDEIRLSDLAGLWLGEEDLFVCRDVALDDEAAANLALQCRLKTI